jgi:phospholipase D3/4
VPLRLFNYEAHNLQVEIVVVCLPAMELDLRVSCEIFFFWQLKVVLAKHATVKVIVAHWAYRITGTEQKLLFLNYTNALCSYSTYNECSGKVEVEFYEVPGWQSVGPALNATTGKPTGAKFPDFTQLSHAKYVVSNVRANIATSNLIWDYFYNTASVSFGTYDPSIVKQRNSTPTFNA